MLLRKKILPKVLLACLSTSFSSSGFTFPELPFCPAGGPPGWFNYFTNKHAQNRWQPRNYYSSHYYSPQYPPANYYQYYYRPTQQQAVPDSSQYRGQNTVYRERR